MCLSPITIPCHGKDGYFRWQTVNCGKCLECLQKYSNEWAFRIIDECSLYDENAFITLTYNDDYLPADNSVSRREVQLFMKRFRKAVSPLRVRFFSCGEYGKKRLRPHYHIIIFNWFPTDCYFWQRDGSVDLFRSPFLEKIWTKGFSSVGKVTLQTARYCAKYMQKWQFDNLLKSDLTPPFVQMSNRPGIGYGAISADCLVDDRIYHNGSFVKVPRYYLKVFEQNGYDLTDFISCRIENGEHIASCTDLNLKRKRFADKFLSKNVRFR